MKIKTLLVKLYEVAKINPDANVYIGQVGSITENGYFDFSGFSVDDNCDVLLDVACGDKEA